MMMSPAEEAEMHVQQLAALDQLLPRYELELEQAERTDAAYFAAWKAIDAEINQIMLTWGGRYCDNGDGYAEIVAEPRRPIPDAVRTRYRQLCGQRRQLEAERATWLKNGGLAATTAERRLHEARLARVVVAAAVAAGY